ncbi:hypothetical protein NDU88_013310 [Pleurodeles waltl]|uniref:Uncharacterized protein n=1 Tax=Pleurodeles waltl TaxID=8319 RepID=A0AAV7R8L6_PLEWA|nr:hypothetical protein NDU88_013310 [Pleurodeles waltl]
MNLTSARVMWHGTHAPNCSGAPIIIVLLGDPWSFKSALGGRVRKNLYNGCIVIDNTSRSDEGFYTVCSSSSEPLLVVELRHTGEFIAL